MCQNARFSENVENLQPSDDRELNDNKLIISLEWILKTINPGPKCIKKWKQIILTFRLTVSNNFW